MANNQLDPYLESFSEVLVDYRQLHDKSIFWVFADGAKRSLANAAINYMPNFLLKRFLSQEQISSFKIKKAQYCFLQIIYALLALNLVNNQFLDNLLSIINDPQTNRRSKYHLINLKLARSIYFSQQTLAFYNIKSLKSLYFKLVRSFPASPQYQHKFYLEHLKHDYYLNVNNPVDTDFHVIEQIENKVKDSEKNYAVLLNEKGDIATPEKNNKLKRFIMAYCSKAIIFLTAFGMGFVTVGLNISAGVFTSLAVVGIPTVIINLVLFNTSVPNLLKDIWHGRLLRNKEGNYIKSSLPLFIISLCGGITYGAMTFITSKAVFDALLVSIPAVASVASGLIIPLAVVFAVSTGISFCALFFGSMIDVVRDGIAEQLLLFKQDFTKHLTKENKLKNLIVLAAKLLRFFATLAGAIYLTIVETALLYSMSVAVLANPPLALLLTIIAAPANVLFTYKIYNSLFNMIINMPQTIRSFWQHCRTVRDNPIAFYETVKWSLSFVGFFIVNMLNARGNGLGLADELQNDNCRAFLRPLGINPSARAVVLSTKIIDMSDVYATNYSEGFDLAFGFVDSNCKSAVSNQQPSESFSLTPRPLTRQYSQDADRQSRCQTPVLQVADRQSRCQTPVLQVADRQSGCQTPVFQGDDGQIEFNSGLTTLTVCRPASFDASHIQNCNISLNNLPVEQLFSEYSPVVLQSKIIFNSSSKVGSSAQSQFTAAGPSLTLRDRTLVVSSRRTLKRSKTANRLSPQTVLPSEACAAGVRKPDLELVISQSCPPGIGKYEHGFEDELSAFSHSFAHTKPVL